MKQFTYKFPQIFLIKFFGKFKLTQQTQIGYNWNMKKLNTNTEVYNYLNIVCRRLGKLYRLTGFSPLPNDFDIDKEKFKEQILLGQMQDDEVFPSFVLESKKDFKINLKNSLKNCKKIIKSNIYKNFSTPKFSEKLALYFDMRLALTEIIMKDFRDHDFDETAAYREIYNLEPVLGEHLEGLYDGKVDLESLFTDLERKYRASYVDKLQRLEKKTTVRMQAQQESENVAHVTKHASKANSKNLGKTTEKTAKNAQKVVKKREIKSVKAQIRSNKSDANKKNKEKG